MSPYKNIVVAIDLTAESQQVIEKAMQQSNDAIINVVHVSEPLTQLYGGEIGVDLSSLEHDLRAQSEKLLSERLQSFDIPEDRQHLVVGKPATEIRQLAKDLEADLIVVGTHSRHGFGLLLGSTANGVLHGAHCDILAVRIKVEK